MRRQLATIFTAAVGCVLLAGASPAAAAPQQATAARPYATTPDGKVVYFMEFVGAYYSLLEPASAGDSVWLEDYQYSPMGKRTAPADQASVGSGTGGFYWRYSRACASTAAGVTCTAFSQH